MTGSQPRLLTELWQGVNCLDQFPRVSRPGKAFLYLVHYWQDGLPLRPWFGQIKIGHAINPHRRWSWIKTGLPSGALLPLAFVQNNEIYVQHMERVLHRAFERSRTSGEWFTPTERLYAVADQLSEPNLIVGGHVHSAGPVAVWDRTSDRGWDPGPLTLVVGAP